MKAVTFICLFLLCMSCRTVRHTTETKRDTTAISKLIPVPLDTTLFTAGFDPITWTTLLPGIHFFLPDTTILKDGVRLTYGIDSTGLRHTLSKGQDTIRIHDTLLIPGADTMIREKMVVYQHVEETWYERIWRQTKDFIIIALILIVLLKLIFK